MPKGHRNSAGAPIARQQAGLGVADVRLAALTTRRAWIGGFEYTMSNIGNSGLDVGLIGEYSHDSRGGGDPDAPLTSVSFFDDDLFVGSRVALNDVQSTELLGCAIIDVHLGSVAWLIEASRRVEESFTMDFEVRAFSRTDIEDPLYSFRRDGFVQLGLQYHY